MQDHGLLWAYIKKRHSLPNYMHNTISKIKAVGSSRTTRQVIILYSSHIIFMVLGLAAATFNVRLLGIKEYGIFAFLITITGFTQLFFNFGIFNAGSYLLAHNTDTRTERQLAGALTLLALVMGLLYAGFIFGCSFFVDSLFHTSVNHILRSVSPLFIALPLQSLLPQLARGTNRIKYLALFRILPKLFYVGLIVWLLFASYNPWRPGFLFALNLATISAGVFIVLLLFKPAFSNLRRTLRLIWQKNHTYGIHIYFGQITNQTTYRLDGLFITWFVGTTSLGFYSLARTLTMPMALLSQSVGTSLFRSFASKEKIPKRVIYINFIWLSSCVIGLALLSRFIIPWFFTDKALPAVKLVLPLAMAGFFQGMYQPYVFLASKGKGKWIRNIAFAEGSVNVIGNFVLIYYWGAMGAALASAASKFVTWVMHLYYYKRYLRQNHTNQGQH